MRDPALISDRARGYVSVGAAFREGFAETFYQLVSHVYADVLRGRPRDMVRATYPTFRDGLAALRVHQAALDSARLGAWQKVEYGSRMLEHDKGDEAFRCGQRQGLRGKGGASKTKSSPRKS